jgi:undecaprenol kinase
MKNNLLKSFGYAFEGIFFLLRNERNFKIHFLALAIVTTAGFFFEITGNEWLVIIIVSTLVIVLEAVNTAIENLCDLYSSAQDDRIKVIKDISAGAVLLATLGAVVAGFMIFAKYFAALWIHLN